MNAHETFSALDQLTSITAAVMLQDITDHEKKRPDFAPRVRALIEHSLATKNVMPLVDDVAAKLAVSAPSLRRWLSTEEASFQAIADDSRRDIATKLLLETSTTIDELAEQLGFSAASGFSRAFKEWTGQSPERYRKLHGNTSLTHRVTQTEKLQDISAKRRGRPAGSKNKTRTEPLPIEAPPLPEPAGTQAVEGEPSPPPPVTSLFDDAPEPLPLDTPTPTPVIEHNALAVVTPPEPVQEYLPGVPVVSYEEQRSQHWQALRAVRLFVSATHLYRE